MVKKKTKTAVKRCASCRKSVGLVSSVMNWVKVKTGAVTSFISK